MFDPVERLAVPTMPTVVVHGHRKIDRAIVPCLKEVVVQVILSVSRPLDWLHVLVINGQADSAWPIYGVDRWFERHMLGPDRPAP